MHQRRVTWLVACGGAVAVAALTRYPYVAGGLSLVSLILTGRAPPDLWSLDTLGEVAGVLYSGEAPTVPMAPAASTAPPASIEQIPLGVRA